MSASIHDTMFRELLTNRDSFIALIQSYLPLDIQKNIQWETLELFRKEGQSIGEKNSLKFIADVIYQVKISHENTFIWVHFEHQTTPDIFMPLRLINYQSGELLKYIKENKIKEKLPPIISIVYHQGQAPYPYKIKLEEIFSETGVKYFGNPILVDLPAIDDKLLRTHIGVGAAEMIMKYSRTDQFSERYEELVIGLRQLDEMSRKVMIKYILRSTDTKKLSHKDVVKIMLKNLPKDQEEIMTVADCLREEGLQQGLKQLHQAKIQIALELLREGRNVNDVCKITQLIPEDVLPLQEQIKH